MTTYYKINYKFTGKRWNFFKKKKAKNVFIDYRKRWSDIIKPMLPSINHLFKRLYPGYEFGDEGTENYRFYIRFIMEHIYYSERVLNKELKTFFVGMNPDTGDFRLYLDNDNYVDYDLTPVNIGIGD